MANATAKRGETTTLTQVDNAAKGTTKLLWLSHSTNQLHQGQKHHNTATNWQSNSKTHSVETMKWKQIQAFHSITDWPFKIFNLAESHPTARCLCFSVDKCMPGPMSWTCSNHLHTASQWYCVTYSVAIDAWGQCQAMTTTYDDQAKLHNQHVPNPHHHVWMFSIKGQEGLPHNQ